jgi:hypothetical protein
VLDGSGVALGETYLSRGASDGIESTAAGATLFRRRTPGVVPGTWWTTGDALDVVNCLTCSITSRTTRGEGGGGLARAKEPGGACS